MENDEFSKIKMKKKKKKKCENTSTHNTNDQKKNSNQEDMNKLISAMKLQHQNQDIQFYDSATREGSQ